MATFSNQDAFIQTDTPSTATVRLTASRGNSTARFTRATINTDILTREGKSLNTIGSDIRSGRFTFAGKGTLSIRNRLIQSTIDGNSAEQSLSVASSTTSTTASLGGGRDSITISASASSSTFDSGADDDTAQATRSARINNTSTINTADGSDSITFASLSQFNDSNLLAGTGSDSITIGATRSPSTMNRAIINLGADTDADRLVINNPLRNRNRPTESVQGLNNVTVTNFGTQDRVTIGGITYSSAQINPQGQSEVVFKGITFKFLS